MRYSELVALGFWRDAKSSSRVTGSCSPNMNAASHSLGVQTDDRKNDRSELVETKMRLACDKHSD